MQMLVRPEKSGDEPALRSLVEAAFKPMSFSDDTEAEALEALRRDGDLTLSLVALIDNEIVGHIAFSPAKVGAVKEGWFGVGPVSVLPEFQRRGVGSNLMETGLERLKAGGATGCVLTGDPAYYGRFGFVSNGAVTYQKLPAKYVQWLSFGGDVPSGEITFSRGLQE